MLLGIQYVLLLYIPIAISIILMLIMFQYVISYLKYNLCIKNIIELKYIITKL